MLSQRGLHGVGRSDQLNCDRQQLVPASGLRGSVPGQGAEQLARERAPTTALTTAIPTGVPTHSVVTGRGARE